jgi:hypothetical protein
MYIHMKTTVEISDALLNSARSTAAREGSTVRALIEEGLRKVLLERKARGAFRLRKVTFRGNGLRADVGQAGWEAIRDMAYEGRGS